ncbi:MAG: PadR family transcriptional regulator [Halobacteriaceae archaeon]
MFQLTGFQRDLLFVIEGLAEPHGLAIKDELEAVYDDEINHGRLYPNLDDLVEMGYVAKGAKDDRTNEYTLTEQGEALVEERHEWERARLDA